VETSGGIFQHQPIIYALLAGRWAGEPNESIKERCLFFFAGFSINLRLKKGAVTADKRNRCKK